mmetsp:Transcript_1820/g.3792  ORF Transcript_1820/g.3792 Transcript_1820/m.3792 type:complete len:232 (-) Transcript_1820:351-1046(-)
MSFTMSAPPWSSPLTNSCGKVGKFEKLFTPSRKLSLLSTSIETNSTSSCRRIATTVAEKPHRGSAGTPFMNKKTGYWLTSSARISSMGLSTFTDRVPVLLSPSSSPPPVSPEASAPSVFRGIPFGPTAPLRNPIAFPPIERPSLARNSIFPSLLITAAYLADFRPIPASIAFSLTMPAACVKAALPSEIMLTPFSPAPACCSQALSTNASLVDRQPMNSMPKDRSSSAAWM